MKIGYFLASEEWGPHEFVEQAKKAEQVRRCLPIEAHEKLGRSQADPLIESCLSPG